MGLAGLFETAAMMRILGSIVQMDSLPRSPTIHLYSFAFKHTGIPAPLVGSHLEIAQQYCIQ